ncbi:MAG: hypothetical protein Q7K65_04800 [Candidatus Buchananbacteria bacterium]|nr:hypothetical protein [Candidatus Buchananbacteria bacterium]
MFEFAVILAVLVILCLAAFIYLGITNNPKNDNYCTFEVLKVTIDNDTPATHILLIKDRYNPDIITSLKVRDLKLVTDLRDWDYMRVIITYRGSLKRILSAELHTPKYPSFLGGTSWLINSGINNGINNRINIPA